MTQMIIEKYIKQLLEERKRVILPGFGNLQVKETGGVVPSGNRIDPPGSQVRFDTSYSNDDGLLASALAEGEKIEKEEARQQVLELVDAIKFALDKGETYSMAETGILSRDEDSKVHFSADPGWVLEPDQYGLESMDLLELEELPPEEEPPETVPKAEETSKVEDDARKEEASKTEEATKKEEAPKAPAEPVSQRKEFKPKQAPPVKPIARTTGQKADAKSRRKSAGQFNRWRIIWIIAGALIIILIALILIPTKRNADERRAIEAARLQAAQTTNEETATDATDDAPVAVPDDSGTQTETGEAETETVPEEPPPVAPDHKYFVIAGSFKHLRNASDLQDQLKSRGYTADVMVTENRMYRVSVASYATKAEAERGLAGLKAERGLESCWLLSN